MVDANMKVLRFYRKACRLIPFILRIHALNSKVIIFFFFKYKIF